MNLHNSGAPTATSPVQGLIHKLETVVDKMHFKLTGNKEPGVTQPATPVESETDEHVEKMLSKSKLITKIQSEVGKTRTEIAGLKDQQTTGLSRLEGMLSTIAKSQGSATARGSSRVILQNRLHLLWSMMVDTLAPRFQSFLLTLRMIRSWWMERFLRSRLLCWNLQPPVHGPTGYLCTW